MFLLFMLAPSIWARPSAGRVDQPAETAFLDRAAPPLLFMENRGQVRDQHGRARPDILFLARQSGVKVAVKADGLSYQFEQHEQPAGADALAPRSPDFDPEKMPEPT
ncbi:MAG: hypothetical protein KDC54_02375, partial [Lewinella sp.]|nr:hypothetical protein [Lewinella sp.]